MSPASASLVPQFDVTVHIMLVETVVDDLLTGQYNNPVRVIAFNTGVGWSRDVSEDVARETVNRAAREDRPLPDASRRFVERHIDEDELQRAGLVE